MEYKEDVHGHKIYYEDEGALPGVKHLESSKFNYAEIKKLCDAARAGEKQEFKTSSTSSKRYELRWSTSQTGFVVKRKKL